MKKNLLKVVCAILLVGMLSISLIGCTSDKNYLQSLEDLGIFNNKSDNMYAQTEIYELVNRHMSTPSTDGTLKKSLIIAFDGARADALSTICLKADQDPNNLGVNTLYSGINEVRKDGGLYLAYCGGDKNDKKKQQATSTSPGFATILTGKWGQETAVVDNGLSMNAESKTILRQYAEQGKTTSFTASWDDHFTVVFKNEVDAPIRPNGEFKGKQVFNNVTNEIDAHQANKVAINEGTDIVFGIYETPDNVGHNSGFGNQNSQYTKAVRDSDNFAYELVQMVKERENEDWLIIITTDHGGNKTWHGKQTMFERTVWFACNKKLH